MSLERALRHEFLVKKLWYPRRSKLNFWSELAGCVAKWVGQKSYELIGTGRDSWHKLSFDYVISSADYLNHLVHFLYLCF